MADEDQTRRLPGPGVVFAGCGCDQTVVNCDYPRMIDPVFATEGHACCFRFQVEECAPIGMEVVQDKRGYDTKETCCILAKGESTCIHPPCSNGGPLCKYHTKTCCFESKVAFPCDEEVPMTFAHCFIVCCRGFPLPFECFPQGQYRGVFVPVATERKESDRLTGGNSNMEEKPTADNMDRS